MRVHPEKYGHTNDTFHVRHNDRISFLEKFNYFVICGVYYLLILCERKREAHAVTTSIDVLEMMRRCDGQITDYGRRTGPILFDPSFGTPHAGERVEGETFLLLRDKGWVTTEDQGVIRRYRISSAGTNYLNEVQSQNKTRAANA